MAITKTHKSAQSELSVKQQNAIDVLVAGAPDREAADAVGVSRETVTRWRAQPHFAAELNRQRQELWGEGLERLRVLVPQAVAVLEGALAEGNVSAAVQVLKAVGLYGNVEPPTGEQTDPELLARQWAEDWAKAELERRGIRPDYSEGLLEELDGGYTRRLRELAEQRRAELLAEAETCPPKRPRRRHAPKCTK